MSAMASQITSLVAIYSIICSGAHQRKHQSSSLVAFVWGIHWWLVDSPHQGPVVWNIFPIHDVIMRYRTRLQEHHDMEVCFTLLNLYEGNHQSPVDSFNTLTPRLNGRPFSDIFKCIFLNENEWISPKISLKFVPKVRFNNIPALVQIMAWRRPGDKPLSEPMLVSLLTHTCATRPQWVNKAPMMWNFKFFLMLASISSF